jgi:acetyltransferase-like isoleucine patch superfamily enzyme
MINRVYRLYLKIFYKNRITLHKGAKIDYRCEIVDKKNISIGQKSILYKKTTIYKQNRAFFKIGEYSHIAPYGYFLMENQNITIGDNVAIGKNCSFFCVTNSIPLDMNILYKDSYLKGDIDIGDNVFIGTNCVILPNTIIESDVVIGANSTIKGRLEKGYLYGGNPVKKIRKVKDV